MKWLNIVLAILMALFVAVQYNDPDGPVWALYYAAGAAAAALAAFRPAVISRMPGRALLWLATLAAGAGVVYYWPRMPGFWHTEVWWQEETAREGMGVMILLAVFIVAMLSTRSGVRVSAGPA